MNEEQERDFLLAGKLAGQTRDLGKSLIRHGASVREILDTCEEFILSKNAGIAFPAQISLNSVAAHACSDEEDETTISVDDVVKLDVGVHVNGMIGDTALTVNLSKEYQELIEASKAALAAACKIATPGTRTGELGAAIQGAIEEKGFAPVKNLSGHGLGYYEIHTTPSIPNIALSQSPELQEDMTIAIEPFASTGKGVVQDSGTATVFTQVTKKPVRSPMAREVLKKIESFNGLPFATRWLSRDFGVGKTKLALRELLRAGIIEDHPPLKDVGNGMVSQYEHSVLVRDTPIITTKNDG